MVRQFFYAASADLYWRAMKQSKDATLAAIAAQSERKRLSRAAIARNGSSGLGDGTEESHRRAPKRESDDLWAIPARCSPSTTAERD